MWYYYVLTIHYHLMGCLLEDIKPTTAFFLLLILNFNAYHVLV